GAGGSQDDLGRERDQFGRVFTHGVGLAVAPAVVDADVLPDSPARLRQALRECRQTGLCFGIFRGIRCEHADAAHPVWLLRVRRERPRRCRAAEQRDERATFHSITSSARASSASGTFNPSFFAALMLMTSSNLVGDWAGKSAGFVPRKIRST